MIVGYLITKIEASRELSDVRGQTTIAQKPEIVDVEKQNNMLVFSFRFTAEYSADNKKYANILVESKIFYISDDIDKILEEWKNKNLRKEVAAEVLEFGSNISLMEIISISKSMQLPLIQLVRVEK